MPEVSICDFPERSWSSSIPPTPTRSFRCDLTWLDLALVLHLRPRLPRASTPTAPTTAAAPSARTSPTQDDEQRVGGAGLPADRAAVAAPRRRRRRAAGSSWRIPSSGRASSPVARPASIDGALHLPEPAGLSGRQRSAHCTCWRWARAVRSPRPSPTSAGSCRCDGSSAPSPVPTTRSYTEVTIGEYGRDGWGAGRCTTSTGTAPPTPRPTMARSRSTASNRDELTALMGPPAYAVLVELCEEFESGRRPALRHPARPRRRAAAARADRVEAAPGQNVAHAPGSPVLRGRTGRAGGARRSGWASSWASSSGTAASIPRFGTRNQCCRWPAGRYLEVVDVLDHPAADKAPFGQAVRARSAQGGGWLGWVVAVDDLGQVEQRIGRPPIVGQRHLPDGARWLAPAGRAGPAEPTRSCRSSCSGTAIRRCTPRPAGERSSCSGSRSPATGNGSTSGSAARLDRCCRTWTSSGPTRWSAPGLVGRDLQHPARRSAHLMPVRRSRGSTPC